MSEAPTPTETAPGPARGVRSLRDETVKYYLETIFYIHHEERHVRPSRIAEWMAVSPATVSTTLRGLESSGWIRVAVDRSVSLTARGRRAAEEIVRSHRLLERWLTDRLGLDWARADEQAQLLAPAFSRELSDALDAHLDRPSTCPHGNVIPGRAAPYGSLVSLADLEPNTPAFVRRISEVAEHDAPDLLRLLHDSGVVIGTRVEVAGARGTTGAISLRTGQRTIAFAIEVARSIWVEPGAPAGRPRASASSSTRGRARDEGDASPAHR